MATKAELQVQVTHLTAALASANERYERLLISSSEYKAQAVSDEIPWDVTPTPVLSFKARCAAAKAQAMATGQVVRI